ncbi:MAG: glycosyltransferase [Verrucomicrobiota bacterium]
MKPKIAFWFRYGPAEHADLFHALPSIIAQLSLKMEIHYFAMKTSKPVPDSLADHLVIHWLPLTISMRSTRDKLIKTLLWVACLPGIALWCRINRVKYIFMDESLPLCALIARIFFGRNFILTVADSFLDVYLNQNALTRWVANCINALDYFALRRLPLIFTRTNAGCAFLASKGVDPGCCHAVYDPCDFSIFHPIPRDAARRQFGIGEKDFVIVHHGILHPNKGNDFIIRALATLGDDIQSLKFLLIGDGPESERIKTLVRELNLEQTVIFTGRLKTLQEVKVGLNCADVGLVMRIGQASDHFHVTGTLVHNMACGLPILAVRLDGIAEIIQEGENGFLFSPNSAEEFGGKLKRLAEDPVLRERIGRAALSDAKRLFAIEAVTAQITKSLETIS